MYKYCKRCGEDKPATTQFFYRDSKLKDGLAFYCKSCKSEMHKKYMSNPKIHERVVAKIIEWRNKHGRDKYLAYRKEYDKSEKRVLWRRKKYNAEPRNFKH